MGMCYAMHTVSDENIELILATPALIWRIITPDDPDIYWDAVRAEKPSSIIARLFGTKKAEPPHSIPTLTFREGENVDDDLDKSWQGLHYCLNKTAYDAEPPMDFLTVGGTPVGNVDVGYGPARAFRQQEVKRLHEWLTHITPDQLKENYDPPAMHKLDIYPDIWQRDGDEGFDYIEENFHALKRFVTQCVTYNLGMIVYLC